MSLDLFSLKGKNVLITGASRGIGRACAVALAEAGANICLVLRPSTSSSNATESSTEAVLQRLGVKVSVIQCNLDDLEAAKQVFPKALELMDGNIHILVNCAGIQRRAPAVQFNHKETHDSLLVTHGAFEARKIINFGSLLTFQGGLTVPAYAAAKGALGSLTKALSNEWSKEGVNVNAIIPGYIATDM
ncbi:hypothetical protein MPER_12568 [Moniliophthora perniciosa FA553]|nr:hypothetical protein MPER_12568 [Moniliophthora perniciosa FA553]